MVSTWVYFALYAFIAGLWMAAAGGALARASVVKDAPNNNRYKFGMSLGLMV